MAKLPEKQKNKIQDVDGQIPVEVAQIIKDLPPDKKQAMIRALSITQHRSGPLPSSDEIKVYNEVIPNGGDRLMLNVEKQLDHRIEIENEGIKRSFNQSSTGQWMAFVLALVFGLIAWDLAKSGFQVPATIIGGIDIVALVAVFITGKITK